MQPREELTQLLTKRLKLPANLALCRLRTFPKLRSSVRATRAMAIGPAPLRCVAPRKPRRTRVKSRRLSFDGIPANDLIENIEIAGPGFINFRLKNVAMQDVVSQVREQGADYGKGTQPEGKRKVNIEYISANPTGPMHVAMAVGLLWAPQPQTLCVMLAMRFSKSSTSTTTASDGQVRPVHRRSLPAAARP